MKFEVNNTQDGYIVEAYISDGTGYGQWYPLRNFGNRQGDARDFMLYDCPKLTDLELKCLIRNFDIKTKYARIGRRRFIKEL